MAVARVIARLSHLEWALRQILEPAHAQMRNRDEVLGCAKAPGRPLDLLQQPVHGLHIGVGAVVQHPPHDAIEVFGDGLGQTAQRASGGFAWPS